MLSLLVTESELSRLTCTNHENQTEEQKQKIQGDEH
jgi:hypothetical protein